MNLDPVQFQSSRFENVDLTLAFFRETLISLGFTAEAKRVQVSITNCDMARMALSALAVMPLYGTRAHEAWTSTIYALRGALASCGALGKA